MGKKISIEIVPVIGRIISKIVLLSHFRKPFIGFMNEAYMREVVLAGKECNYFEFGIRHFVTLY